MAAACIEVRQENFDSNKEGAVCRRSARDLAELSGFAGYELIK